MRQIFDTIQKYQMIRPGMGVLAGVSGGADSVCLLLALAEYRRECPFSLSVIHVEHGIRGEESLADAEFVRQLCGNLGLACRVESCDVPGEARRRGMSLEETARALRYEIFERVRLEEGADVVAVAHNENDQAETVLWNLIRGSALKGLCGMQPVRGNIIRPLLYTPRSRIEQILSARGAACRTDRTNLDPAFTRNRLRLEVLPYLEEHLNHQAVRHIAEAASRLAQAQAYLEAQASRALASCAREADGGVLLELGPFWEAESFLQGELLRGCIRLCGGGEGLRDVGSVHIDMLRELAGMPCGKQLSLPGRLTAERRAGTLFFRKETEPARRAKGTLPAREECPPEYPLAPGMRLRVENMEVSMELLSREEVSEREIFTENKYTKWLSCDTIKSNVCLRKRRAGDYLVVNAAGGTKKLKDYLIGCRIPREERDRLWLLADGSHVLWVIGYRISEGAKVTKDTRKIMKITVRKEESL